MFLMLVLTVTDVCCTHRNSSVWSDLWMRGDANSERLQKHPLNEQLTIMNLKSSDEGTYKVLDEHGLAVSTVQLSVEGETPINLLVHLSLKMPNILCFQLLKCQDFLLFSFSCLLELRVFGPEFNLHIQGVIWLLDMNTYRPSSQLTFYLS